MLNDRLNADATIDCSALDVTILAIYPGSNDSYPRKKASLGSALAGFLIFLVPTARLELAQLAPLPPQDSVSTNFTTSASRPVFYSCLASLLIHNCAKTRRKTANPYLFSLLFPPERMRETYGILLLYSYGKITSEFGRPAYQRPALQYPASPLPAHLRSGLALPLASRLPALASRLEWRPNR